MEQAVKMEQAFEDLKKQALSKDLRTCIETLIKVFRNIVQNPSEERYRSLRVTNSTFNNGVWKFEGGRGVMLAVGWQLCGDLIILPDTVCLKQPLNFLIDNRNVKPSADEWVEETKHIIPNAANEKERKLRAVAQEQKEKDMKELKKDMAERKQIAEQTRRDHCNDGRNMRVLPSNSRVTGTILPRTAIPSLKNADDWQFMQAGTSYSLKESTTPQTLPSSSRDNSPTGARGPRRIAHTPRSSQESSRENLPCSLPRGARGSRRGASTPQTSPSFSPGSSPTGARGLHNESSSSGSSPHPQHDDARVPDTGVHVPGPRLVQLSLDSGYHTKNFAFSGVGSGYSLTDSSTAGPKRMRRGRRQPPVPSSINSNVENVNQPLREVSDPASPSRTITRNRYSQLSPDSSLSTNSGAISETRPSSALATGSRSRPRDADTSSDEEQIWN